jgi:hypothetical protein
VPVYFPGQMFGKPHMYLHGYARLLLRPVEPVGGEGEKVRYFNECPGEAWFRLNVDGTIDWLRESGEPIRQASNLEGFLRRRGKHERDPSEVPPELLSPPASSKPDLQEEIERLKRTIAEDDAKIARLEQQLSLAGECYRMTREMLEETWKQFNIARNKS